MIKRRDYTSFDDFHESGTAGNWEELTFIRENGWKKADLLTECKSWKTAINRFFKAIGTDPDFEGWKECLEESCENGYFAMNDNLMADGSRNEYPSWAYGLEPAGDYGWYIFLNVAEEGLYEHDERSF